MSKVKKEEGKKPKSKAVSIIVDVILVLAIVFALFATYSAYTAKQGDDLPGLFGVKMASVLSDSMKPTFEKGDMIFCTAVKDASTLQVGDVITFHTVINGERTVNTHRIISISDGGSHRIFTTQGDNNSVADSLSVHENDVIGKYRFHIPNLGSAFEFLQTSTGFLIIIVIPVAIFFLWQLVQFFMALFAYQAEKVKLQYAASLGIQTPASEEKTEEAKGAPASDGTGEAKEQSPSEKKDE